MEVKDILQAVFVFHSHILEIFLNGRQKQLVRCLCLTAQIVQAFCAGVLGLGISVVETTVNKIV